MAKAPFFSVIRFETLIFENIAKLIGQITGNSRFGQYRESLVAFNFFALRLAPSWPDGATKTPRPSRTRRRYSGIFGDAAMAAALVARQGVGLLIYERRQNSDRAQTRHIHIPNVDTTREGHKPTRRDGRPAPRTKPVDVI